MASDTAIQTPGTGETSLVKWLALLGVFTLLAGGGGAGLGLYLSNQPSPSSTPAAKEEGDGQSPAHAANLTVRELPPIITNLQTSDVWVRIHAAIIYDPSAVPTPDIMISEITTDILGFLQTLSIAQLAGASGLQHLREDLNDRVLVRSEGHIRELVIESVVVQ